MERNDKGRKAETEERERERAQKEDHRRTGGNEGKEEKNDETIQITEKKEVTDTSQRTGKNERKATEEK